MYWYYMKFRMISHNLWQQLISPTLCGSLGLVHMEGLQKKVTIFVLSS